MELNILSRFCPEYESLRHKTTQRFGAARLFGSSPLTLSRFCTAGVVSTAALEHLEVMLGGKAQRSHQSGVSPDRVHLSSVLQRQGTNPDCTGGFPCLSHAVLAHEKVVDLGHEQGHANGPFGLLVSK